MRETVFIKQNLDKWHDYEYRLSRGEQETPAALARMYSDVSADLAFAQSQYPNSQITSYLNDLTIMLHGKIYKEKAESPRRLLTFWTREVPLTMWRERKYLFIALAVFLVSALIGAVSAHYDSSFARLIMGDGYIDMTLQNIANGKPMDVYDGDSELYSFLAIMFNNIRVAFLAFTMGVFTSLGTGYILFYNGIMVGTFFSFLHKQGVLAVSWTAVMLHGTLELWVIVVAAAAGICMGNGWLFPGTYSRMTSFRRSAKRGFKIVVGTVPVYITAAFIEGFFTRHVEWSLDLKLCIIGASAAFIIFYYFIYPAFFLSHDDQQ